jgi:hypothetical protein
MSTTSANALQDLPGAAFLDPLLRHSSLDIRSMMAIQELHIEPQHFWDNISLPQFEVRLQNAVQASVSRGMYSTAASYGMHTRSVAHKVQQSLLA